MPEKGGRLTLRKRACCSYRKGVIEIIRYRLDIVSALLLLFGFHSACWPGLVITSPSTLPDGAKGEPYNFQLEAEGAVGEVTWDAYTGEDAYVEIETPHHFAGTANALGIIEPSGGKEDVPLPFGFRFYG